MFLCDILLPSGVINDDCKYRPTVPCHLPRVEEPRAQSRRLHHTVSWVVTREWFPAASAVMECHLDSSTREMTWIPTVLINVVCTSATKITRPIFVIVQLPTVTDGLFSLPLIQLRGLVPLTGGSLQSPLSSAAKRQWCTSGWAAAAAATGLSVAQTGSETEKCDRLPRRRRCIDL